MSRKKWRSHSPEETIQRARLVAKSVRPGTLIALVGELGSGKTTFVKGLASGLGVKDARDVKSPTFVIFHMYEGRIPLYHFDLFRLDESSDLEGIGIVEFLADPNAVSVIEWADRVPSVLEQAHLTIQLTRNGESDRTIEIQT